MKVAFTKITWGLIIILIDIHIFVDILPNPIGYYLIYQGVVNLTNQIDGEKKASYLAAILTFISIPSVFIPQNQGDLFLETFSLWSMYPLLLGLLKLVLVFYIFQLMLDISRLAEVSNIHQLTTRLCNSYVILSLLFYIIETFSINFVGNGFNTIKVIVTIVMLIWEIRLLILVNHYKKVKPISLV
ncbi:hypothetical protein ACFFIS_06330 [Virgibacillus soli]|uniref:Uncharacterized protein n=1 Tax=Paracerasibacillus soli TaxID=480284 RepID=A0ABU5CTZ4_9BACI|nr:hypothetical protein [Virgibacillus soli]MDY0409828.1 hypothetical protein [Virgibacillus soli]